MSKSKAKGTAWESEVVAALRRYKTEIPGGYQLAHWPNAERRALQGTLDKGDITGIPGVMIECKAEKAITLAEYAKQVEVQTTNAGADIGACWIKRRGKAKAEDGYVVMSGDTFMRLLADTAY